MTRKELYEWNDKYRDRIELVGFDPLCATLRVPVKAGERVYASPTFARLKDAVSFLEFLDGR